ncbi:hypothetical protein LH460_09275 [Laribacter hongkongensis]|uniref:hypothetical protein n=1 Tax=Laribacter hongkongensis TaxID=168471 RepID=UPI001EFE8A1F|nr:hypothetical protein [Laribacter hongkongensis]MCG9124863.1 hypothetical protein [Laribacter hongkongensis]
MLKATPFKGKFMPYGWGALPQKLPAEWMPYVEMFKEFYQELANIVNDLTRYTHQLAAWCDVVDKLDDKGKFNVAIEFVDPLATIALNLPYVIRSRFIFAAAHLCHQAGRAKAPKGWKDDLALDDEIYFAQAEKAGSLLKAWAKLKLRLERIGDRSYKVNTKDFRNTYNHRFSPRVVVGQTNIVTRKVDAKSKQVSYEFGGTEPLTLKLVVELLEEQCQHCYKAFESFQMLVQEQEKAISAAAAETLAAMAASAKS